MQKSWQKFVNGKNGEPVMWQRPNLPLFIWAFCFIIGHSVADQALHQALSIAGTVSLTIWAIAEIGWGTSYFRRALGVAIFANIVITQVFK